MKDIKNTYSHEL